MPIANGFLAPEQFDWEFFYDLRVAFCPACRMVQLGELVPPDRLFHEQYVFFSSILMWMARHFKHWPMR